MDEKPSKKKEEKTKKHFLRRFIASLKLQQLHIACM